jgi:uncharacterized protein YfaS (alpha-2-macroglobulin family)
MFVAQSFRALMAGAYLVAFSFLNLANAAEIEFFSPQGEVKKVRQVVARFNDQMMAFGDPREVAPFDVSCPAPGHSRWADGKNWIYDFDEDLPAGVSCTFILKNSLVSVNGKKLAGGEHFQFNTGGPAILRSEPYDGSYGIDEDQVFILGLDAPVKPQTIEQNAFCLAEGSPEQIPVRLLVGAERRAILDQRVNFLTSYYSVLFKSGAGARHGIILGVDEHGSDREKFLKLRDDENSPIAVLQCKRSLPNEARVMLRWGAGIMSKSGIQTSQAQVLSFRVRPTFEAKFSCERVNADAACIPALPMGLNFSAPISIKDARQIRLVSGAGKAVRPTLPKEVVKQGYVESLAFPAPLPEQTEFRVEIPAGLKDDAGRLLANASSFPLAVRTDENPPLVKFPSDFGILELNASPNTPPLLPVTLRNVEPQLDTAVAKEGPDDASINGQVSHGSSELEVIEWLNRLRVADRYDGEKDSGPGKKSVFESGDKRTSFKMPKPLGSKAFEVVGIPLKDPGFYVVELASPRLGEALHGQNRPYYVHTAALVTNLAVHFKQGRESSLVWVTSLDAGKPVADASVAVRDCQGKIYYEGRTDAQGLLQVNKELPETSALPHCMDYRSEYFVTARKGRDFSFVFSSWGEGISPWRFNLPTASWTGPYNAHAVMDRTLLRAGETVHLKLFVRKRTRTGFTDVDFKLPSSIAIEHQASEQKYDVAVKWGEHGTATAEWQIPQDAKQGVYTISLNGARGELEAGQFQVESFRVPTMKAIVQGPSAPLVNAEQATINVQVNYLSGGGASFASVKLRGQIQNKAVSFPDYEDFTFANGTVKVGAEKNAPWYMGDYQLSESGDEEGGAGENHASGARLLPTQTFQLDGAGAGHATFTRLSKSDVPQDIRAELEYKDANGETLNAAGHVALWPSQVVVGIKPDGWIATPEHVKFQALVLDLKGKPVAGSKVAVTALQREFYSHRRRLLGGFYAFDHHSEVKVLGEVCQGTTDAKGLVLCDVKSPAGGNIILQARAADAAGNASAANREIWVAGSDDWWFDASDNDRTDLLPEKKRYEPGETARLQVRMPFKEASVLVTMEREGVMESFVTTVTRDKPVIEVPIKGNYAPNVFVSAFVVRGRVAGIQPTALVDLAKPAYKMGVANIKVGWAAHELKVKVATDKPTYKVRERAKVVVDVRRADGSAPPAGSEIALAAVDEGLLELKPNNSWQLLDAMMQPRGIEVVTSTAQMQVIGKRHFGRKAVVAGGDGGGRKSARELFDTLLFWQGRVKLDSQGHAEAWVPLNDSLTSFRIVAIGSGDTGLFGTGATSINTTQDLMLLSGLSPIVREQDRYHATFTVRNASERRMEVNVAAKLNVALQGKPPMSSDLSPIALTLAAGEARDIGWDTTAPIDGETLEWNVSAHEKGAKDEGDRLKVKQKVIWAVPVRTFQATIMQLEKTADIKVKLPAGSIPGRGGVRVTFRKKLGDGLAGVQEYMSRYPYTCFEQQASVAVALQDEASWNALMRRLPAYLDHEGLVKYFPIMQEGSEVLTAYLLSVAAEAGYAIPDTHRERMRSGLQGFVEGRVIRYSDLRTMDLSIRKLAAIEALSREGAVDNRWFDSFTIEPNLWPTSAVLDWLAILKRAPGVPMQAARLEEAQQIIRSRLNFQGTTMGFSTERNDALWWLMISGDVNSNRALLALYDLDSWRPDVPRLVQGTLGRQLSGHWNTTVANAWGVLAMKKFSEKFESVAVSGTTSATLNNVKFEATWTRAQNSAAQLLPWPQGLASLNLEHKGDGKPWATLQSLAALPLKEPLFTGYRIVRKVTPVEQKSKDGWHKGDVVRVHLDLEAQSDMTWVVVNDPIPAGAAILGTGLGGDSQILTGGEKKEGWVWPAFEERTFDSFRAYYRFVPKGKWSLEYTVRLNSDGAFQLPVTRVEAMYAPEMFGELPNKAVEVRP